MLLKAVFLVVLQGLIGISSTGWASPRLTQTVRVQTERSSYGEPKLIHDARGNPIFVQLSALPEDDQNLELAAYDQAGTKVASMKLTKPQGPGEFLSMDSAAYNVRGELVVITSLYRGGNSAGRIYADNLTLKTGVRLTNEGEGSYIQDRIHYNNQDLLLVVEYLGHGEGNTNPFMIRLMDQDTGQILKHKILDQAFSGRFGVDRAGKLKLLLLGYELFGVLDLATGDVKELLPRRSQPSQPPQEVELSIGKFIELTDEKGVRLFDRAALLEGKLKAARTYPEGTTFIGEGKPWVAVTHQTIHGKRLIILVDLATGQSLGKWISEDKYPFAQFDGIVKVAGRTVFALSQPENPDSFLQGTIQTYIDIASGTILRSRTVVEDELTTELKEGGPDQLIAIERVKHWGKGFDLDVVELFDNVVLSQAKSIGLVGGAFRTGSGSLVALHGTEESELCVMDLLQPSDETCVHDPLVRGAVVYGYRPFDLETGNIRLPLMGKRQGFNFPTFGYVEFKVE